MEIKGASAALNPKTLNVRVGRGGYCETGTGPPAIMCVTGGRMQRAPPLRLLTSSDNAQHTPPAAPIHTLLRLGGGALLQRLLLSPPSAESPQTLNTKPSTLSSQSAPLARSYPGMSVTTADKDRRRPRLCAVRLDAAGFPVAQRPNGA